MSDIKYFLRKLWHQVYPWTGLNGLDRKIIPYLPKSGGFFVEAGANDGIRQSNTYYLEKRRGWTGLLVEPIPRLALRCRTNRKNSIVEECVLVAPENIGQAMEIVDLDLMTAVVDGFSDESEMLNRISLAEKVQKIRSSKISVASRSLNSLLELHQRYEIDLLSLDVEGFELEVLKGLDLNKFSVSVILIETTNLDLVQLALGNDYILAQQFSHHDYLFIKK
jgi:FkbM family methyltransferase